MTAGITMTGIPVVIQEGTVAAAVLQNLKKTRPALQPEEEAVPVVQEEVHQAAPVHQELQAGAGHLQQAAAAVPQAAGVLHLRVQEQEAVQEVLKKAAVKNKKYNKE